MGLWEIEIDNLRGVESRVYQIERVWVFGQTSTGVSDGRKICGLQGQDGVRGSGVSEGPLPIAFIELNRCTGSRPSTIRDRGSRRL
jgi:hypothetical protein